LVEKWIPPSRSEIAEIGKKTEGILGVNIYQNTQVVWDGGSAYYTFCYMFCIMKTENIFEDC
jgi:hypothetical protein